MRFTLALAGLLATAAATAVDVDAGADAGVGAYVAPGVDAKVKADVDAKVKADVDAKVKADVDAKVNVDAKVDADVDVNADIDVDADVDASIAGLLNIDASASASVSAAALTSARRAAASFRCPAGMSYCPWTRACACPPGQRLDARSRRCAGAPLTGAWPRPRAEPFAARGVRLAAYCAASPYRVVPYSPAHRYCRAGLDTLAFVAAAGAAPELAARAGADIDVRAAGVGADLRAVVAGLAALYVGTAADAVVLFNTDAFGHAVARADVAAGASLGLLGGVRGLFCAVGLGRCNYDCVSYCAKGCKNYIDIDVGVDADAEIGAGLAGLVGLCILPDVLLVVNAAKVVVTVAVDGLLCLVGGLLKGLLGALGCHC